MKFDLLSGLLLSVFEHSLLADSSLRHGNLYVFQGACTHLDNLALYTMFTNLKLPTILAWNTPFYNATLRLTLAANVLTYTLCCALWI